MWSKVITFLSVSGVSVATLVGQAWAAHLSIAIFFLVCLIVICRVFAYFRHLQKNLYPRGCIFVSAIARYSTLDGKNFRYEVIRHLQIKNGWMNDFYHRFYWTGTKSPKIASSLQVVDEHLIEEPDGYKKVCFKFKHPKFYNQTEVLHFEMELDDSDQKSEPYLSFEVHHPMQLIEFRVDLIHATKKYFTSTARLEKRKIGVHHDEAFELIRNISFDSITKSYRATEPNPAPDFSYRIKWEKPPQCNQPRAKK